MAVIWKFPIETTDVVEIEMPEGAEILTVQTQGQQLCIWAKVDSQAKTNVRRRILTFGTGHPFNGGMGLKYIGAYQLRDGTLVFHVFEQEY